MIDLTPIFQAIIALLAALVTYKLIPWIKARTTDTQQANLYAMAKVAVYAAEQLYGAGQGDKKLEYARKVLQNAGYDVDTDVLRAAIESAVHNMPVFTISEIVSGDDNPKDDEPAPGAPVIKQAYEMPTQPEVDEGTAEIFAGTEPVSMDEIGEHQAPGIVDPPPDGGK